MSGLTHFDAKGSARMVDVGGKDETERTASAQGLIRMNEEAMQAVLQGTAKKGDVLGVARVAGIMALKKTAELIPLCHTLLLTGCGIEFETDPQKREVRAVCTVRCHGRTGVEMEALTGVSVALLTVYDMLKAVDKYMTITDIHLVRKTGGKSGDLCWTDTADPSTT